MDTEKMNILVNLSLELELLHAMLVFEGKER